MHRITNHEYSQETLQRSLKGVTFFKELAVSDPAQFDVLLSVAKIEQADANEVIIHQGEATQSLYFLLRGELSVFTTDETHALNTINAGEVFGVMSMLSGKPRSASIKALSKPVLVAAIDFKYFSDIDNFILFNMASKIAFYRMVVNSIRWTLEVNKMADGQHPLVAQLRKVPLYLGLKGHRDELEALHQQSYRLAELLEQWNVSKLEAPAC